MQSLEQEKKSIIRARKGLPGASGDAVWDNIKEYMLTGILLAFFLTIVGWIFGIFLGPLGLSTSISFPPEMTLTGILGWFIGAFILGFGAVEIATRVEINIGRRYVIFIIGFIFGLASSFLIVMVTTYA